MRRFVIVASIAIIVGLGVTMIASAFSAGENGDGGVPLRQTLVAGPSEQKAAAAALRFTGGGTVDAVTQSTLTGAGYDVAVSQPGGGEVDVRLDRNFKPLGINAVSSDGGDGGD